MIAFIKSHFSEVRPFYICTLPTQKYTLKSTWEHLTLACLAGTRSASSLPFHLIKNINSPDESVAPIIRSACQWQGQYLWKGEKGILEPVTWRPLSKPLGLISSPGWAFLAAGSSFELGPGRFLFSCSVQEGKTAATCNSFSTCSFFCLSLSSNALISSGQSRFSRGSHVFSSGPKPFHER